MAVCSTKAIKVDGLSYEHDFMDLPDHNMDHNNFINFLANWRSIRNFKDKPISGELIKLAAFCQALMMSAEFPTIH